MKLNKKRELITGGAQGIGFAIAETFCRVGAVVYIEDINAEFGSAAHSELVVGGGSASFVDLDVSNDSDCSGVCWQIT